MIHPAVNDFPHLPKYRKGMDAPVLKKGRESLNYVMGTAFIGVEKFNSLIQSIKRIQ